MRYNCIHCRKTANAKYVRKVMASESCMLRGICSECVRKKTHITSNN